MTEQPEETRTGQEQDFAMGPMVSVVFRSGDNPDPFPFSDLALEGDDPALISDDTLIERVARWLDRDVNDFDNMVVTRPETGNLLISPKAVYGNENHNDTWAVVELMGHVTIAGRVTQPGEYGGLWQLDIPNGDTFRTEFFGSQSVYRIRIVSEDIARAYARPGHEIVEYDAPIVTRTEHETAMARAQEENYRLREEVRELRLRLTAVNALPPGEKS